MDYPALTGVPGSGERVMRSLNVLLESGIAHELRVTVHERLLQDWQLIDVGAGISLLIGILLDRPTEQGVNQVVLQVERLLDSAPVAMRPAPYLSLTIPRGGG